MEHSIDREKVIKGLENAPNTVKDGFYYLRITHKLRDDALALLKEQEEETRFIHDDYYAPKCEKCGFKPFVGYIPTIEWMKNRGFKKCPHCGRSVKWE